MAQKNINLGSADYAGDGENIRSAFAKIQDNFTENYTSITSINGNIVTINNDVSALQTTTSGHTQDITNLQTQVTALGGGSGGSIDADLNGSVFGDDSTLLIDGTNSTIIADVLTGALPAIDGSQLLSVNAQFLDSQPGAFYLDYNNLVNTPAVSALPEGSTHSIDIVASDSTLLVDSVNGTLNATALTGALPAIDGSALTGITTTETDPVVGAITGIVKADGAGNISAAVAGTDYLTTVAFADLTLTPTTIAGYGITDAFDGDYNNLTNQPTVPTAINDLTDVDTATAAPSRDAQPLVWDTVDGNWYPGNGISISAIARIETGGMLYFDASSSMVFEGTTANNFETTITASDPSQDNAIVIPDASGTLALTSDIPTAYTDSDVDTHLNQSTAGTNEVLSWDGADYAWVAQSGGGSGLQSRSTATGTTSSLADAAEADLDITGFKSYALLTITTDRAARVRLYVSAATRTADASRAEGVDPTSDAGLIAEVITTGADTVIISPGAYGFNLESSPTTTIPCRVTNKSGGASTVQVDLNILQLEA